MREKFVALYTNYAIGLVYILHLWDVKCGGKQIYKVDESNNFEYMRNIQNLKKINCGPFK